MCCLRRCRRRRETSRPRAALNEMMTGLSTTEFGV